MEKCWFVLKQTHYPPPKGREGPIQLGHLIPDLKRLDQVINVENGPTKFPRGMAVYPSNHDNFKWKRDTESTTEVSASASLPIDSAGVVSAGGQAGVMFARSVENFWEFERLEKYIVQPTVAYIKKSLEDPAVEDYIKANKKAMGGWSIFMITGLAIAKGASGKQSEGRKNHVHGGPSVNVAGIVEVGTDVAVTDEVNSSSSFKASSDFIWAIRIAKIHKSLFKAEWGFHTHTKGATYSLEDEKEVKEELASEGLELDEVVEDGDQMFVMTKDEDI